ncbi:MAG: hypothetical protein GMKNLPBB_02359 [Myxococcota bacterium]|nr:hypothetical protein [Myxococcota bacterium]
MKNRIFWIAAVLASLAAACGGEGFVVVGPDAGGGKKTPDTGAAGVMDTGAGQESPDDAGTSGDAGPESGNPLQDAKKDAATEDDGGSAEDSSGDPDTAVDPDAGTPPEDSGPDAGEDVTPVPNPDTGPVISSGVCGSNFPSQPTGSGPQCLIGLYKGGFKGILYISSSNDTKIDGTLEFNLVEDPSTGKCSVTGGKLSGVATANSKFQAELTGEFDCVTFKGKILNGSVRVFGIPYNFEGDITGDYDPNTIEFKNGKWNIVQTGGGTLVKKAKADGTWEAKK